MINKIKKLDKNRIKSFNLETMTLLDDSIIITYKDDYFEDLKTSYQFHKKLQEYFNKKIVFEFNGIWLELDRKSRKEDIIKSYDEQYNELFKIQINNCAEEIINKIKEGNQEEKLLIELSLLLDLCNSKNKIISLNNRRKIIELFYNNQYPSLIQGIEIPKVKIKNK